MHKRVVKTQSQVQRAKPGFSASFPMSEFQGLSPNQDSQTCHTTTGDHAVVSKDELGSRRVPLKSAFTQICSIKVVTPLLGKEPLPLSFLCSLPYWCRWRTWQPYLITWLLQLFWCFLCLISIKWFLVLCLLRLIFHCSACSESESESWDTPVTFLSEKVNWAYQALCWLCSFSVFWSSNRVRNIWLFYCSLEYLSILI